jgi:hypothetical protein
LAPNPADDVLLLLDTDAHAEFEVLASNGRRVEVPFRRTGSTVHLDVHALVLGLYSLRSGQGAVREAVNISAPGALRHVSFALPNLTWQPLFARAMAVPVDEPCPRAHWPQQPNAFSTSYHQVPEQHAGAN